MALVQHTFLPVEKMKMFLLNASLFDTNSDLAKLCLISKDVSNYASCTAKFTDA